MVLLHIYLLLQKCTIWLLESMQNHVCTYIDSGVLQEAKPQQLCCALVSQR